LANSEEAIWAIVEIFGHQTYVGQVKSHLIGSCNFIRVDIPKVDEEPAYTKIFGERAIYSITPVEQATALRLLRHYRPEPVNTYALPAPKFGQSGEDE